MNNLPASIEAYLLDAAFSSTEIHILKRLLEEDAMTLRQIAAKTGKSTGVLNQAMDKLIRKNIIVRESINESAKYSLTSLDAIKKWMEQDIKQKREELTRRHQSFETFLATLTKDKTRPEMQHFSGIEGIEQAYKKVMEHGKEMLQYVPVIWSAEDDPMRDFRVEYFRERRRRGIFSRVIAHNTTLGRRYQSRDPFEYRQTMLVPEDQYPFSFEKIIIGNTVTCINFLEKRACFLHYPELAHMEKVNFEGIWRQENKSEKSQNQEQLPSAATVSEPVVPLKVKTLSRLREFFLSRESLVSMGVLAVVAGVITFGLYQYTSAINLQRMKERVMSIAATGVYQFTAEELNALRKEEDWKRPKWAQVVNKLKQIRENNKDITFAYIIRKTINNKIEFVADSHSLYPYANVDADPTNDINVDNEGILDGTSGDQLQWPGQIYNGVPPEAFDGFNSNTTSEIYEDQWGRYLSGYAPIHNKNGITVAVLAIDIQAVHLQKLNTQTFTPLLYFLGIFAVFLLIRLAAFNRSLLREMWDVFQMRKVLIVLILCGELSFAITFGLYKYMLYQTIQDVGGKLMSVVATGASQFDVHDLEQLHWAKDMKTDAYQRVFKKLNQIKDANPDITYIYIERLVEKPYLWEFVADSYSNYYLPFIGPDMNEDGILDDTDENVAPGIRYWNDTPEAQLAAQEHPAFDEGLNATQWGDLISGYAPVKDENGNTVAILGADIVASEINDSLHRKFDPWLWFTGGFSLLLILYLLIWRQFKA